MKFPTKKQMAEAGVVNPHDLVSLSLSLFLALSLRLFAAIPSWNLQVKRRTHL